MSLGNCQTGVKTLNGTSITGMWRCSSQEPANVRTRSEMDARKQLARRASDR